MCRLLSLSLSVALGVLVASPAQAASPYTPIPPEPGAKALPLQLSIVGYDGSTNGEMRVRIKNTGKEAQTFNAQGLYFVPQVAAAQAPQRLGAVGPMQTKGGNGGERTDAMTIAPGATVDVVLDVFCIDSHRASPTSETPFALATDRLPKQLTQEINADAKKAADSVGGFAAPVAKSAVQSEVWKNRDKKWIKLQGEGVQEATK